MLINVEQLGDSAVKVGTEIRDTDLRPLLLFRGNLSFGVARSRLGVLRSMMLAEVTKRSEIVAFSHEHADAIHLVGVHKPIASSGLGAFLCRLYSAPDIMPKVHPQLREYLDWFTANNRILLYRLDAIAETAYRTLRDWRRVERPLRARKESPPLLQYPYIGNEPTQEHALMMSVHAAVPKGIPPEIRGDLCQDLIVAVLMGEIKIENLKDEYQAFARRSRSKYQNRYGDFSLNSERYEGRRWEEFV